MSSKAGFSAKLASFQSRFKSLLGAKAQGYDELNTLERPLVSDVHEQEEYERDHGVQAPGSYRPPAAAGYPPAATGVPGQAPAHHLPAPPSQADELAELSVLARDAAEILWEMVAMGEGGAAVADMKGKAEQLQAQLRGLIGDYQGGDEAAYAAAFESFDMLSRCLEEQEAPAAPAGVPPAVPATATAPAAVAGSTAPAAVSAPPAEEAPLISFD